QAAGDGDVGGRRRRGIVRGDLQALDAADDAAVQARLQRLEVRIEAAVEGEQHVRPGQCLRGAAGARVVLVDGFFAEDRLAGGRGAQAVVEVGVGGAGDDHAAD